ncbi:MAG: hypothetical protein M1823_002734 [Watsoniomyces obsoletus]|nr:MAG: hypothetical protein M1823_002734 [Watsoniomyces obsoletus]
MFTTLIWSSRELEIILMFAGQLACEALNFGLKRLIKEERPKRMYGKGYGLPSSHAQFVAFFSVYLALFLLLRHQPRPTDSHRSLALAERALLSILGLMGATLVAASRVYLHYHTPKQVLVGVGAGIICAVVWFAMTSWARQVGLLDFVLDHPISQLLRIRDLVVEEDLVHAGYERWLAMRRTSKRSIPSQQQNKGKKRVQ